MCRAADEWAIPRSTKLNAVVCQRNRSGGRIRSTTASGGTRATTAAPMAPSEFTQQGRPRDRSRAGRG